MTIPGVIYLAALIFGLGVQALQFILSGSDSDTGAEGDFDADHDVDLDGDADAEHGADHAGHDGGGFLPIVLSIRFWTFGLLAFGMVGSLLHFLRLAPMSVTPFVAVVVGLACGFFASWIFKALSRADTQSGAGPDEAVGQVGKVLVPVRPDARGKVRIQLRGQTADFLARGDGEQFDVGATVLVTEVEEGQLRVARAPAEFLRLDDDEQ